MGALEEEGQEQPQCAGDQHHPAQEEGQHGLEVALGRPVDLDPVEVAPRRALDGRRAVRARIPLLVVGDHAVALHAVEVARLAALLHAGRLGAFAVVVDRFLVALTAGLRPVVLAHVPVAADGGVGIVFAGCHM